jgi:hypothetical protein
MNSSSVWRRLGFIQRRSACNAWLISRIGPSTSTSLVSAGERLQKSALTDAAIRSW